MKNKFKCDCCEKTFFDNELMDISNAQYLCFDCYNELKKSKQCLFCGIKGDSISIICNDCLHETASNGFPYYEKLLSESLKKK